MFFLSSNSMAEISPNPEALGINTFFFFFFFYLGFLSRTFTIHGTAGEGGGYLFNSSLPFPPASQTLRHWPGDCCRQLTSAHSWQPDSNREPLVSERKSLTTKLRALSSPKAFHQHSCKDKINLGVIILI